jgi:hypothetical protein
VVYLQLWKIVMVHIQITLRETTERREEKGDSFLSPLCSFARCGFLFVPFPNLKCFFSYFASSKGPFNL